MLERKKKEQGPYELKVSSYLAERKREKAAKENPNVIYLYQVIATRDIICPEDWGPYKKGSVLVKKGEVAFSTTKENWIENDGFKDSIIAISPKYSQTHHCMVLGKVKNSTIIESHIEKGTIVEDSTLVKSSTSDKYKKEDNKRPSFLPRDAETIVSGSICLGVDIPSWSCIEDSFLCNIAFEGMDRFLIRNSNLGNLDSIDLRNIKTSGGEAPKNLDIAFASDMSPITIENCEQFGATTQKEDIIYDSKSGKTTKGIVGAEEFVDKDGTTWRILPDVSNNSKKDDTKKSDGPSMR